jgi:hypothetical protein
MTTTPVLDWRPNPDPRSEPFRFSNVPMCSNLTARHSIMRTKTVHLDQGREGACTGFGEEHVRALSPYPQTTSDAQAQRVYERARHLDEWPGEDYEGSSVNGAMKAAREFGWIREWRWAKTGEEIRHGLSYHGAGEAGTWWYSGMFDTDVDGFIYPRGSKVGGHAYAIAGYGWLNGFLRYRIENSWGPAWGDNGGAWMWEYDLLPLLEDQGEMAFPQKVRL